MQVNSKRSDHHILRAFGIGLVLIMMLPVAVVVWCSFTTRPVFGQYQAPFQLYAAFFQDSAWRGAFLRSVTLSGSATLIAALLASAVVMEIKIKGPRLQYLGPVMALVPLTVLIPAMVLGIALSRLLRAVGTDSGGWPLFLVHVALAFPFVLICCLVGARNVSIEILESAATCGADRKRTYFQVLLPQMSRGLLAGIVLGFLYSFDELVITQFLCSPRATPISVMLWSGLRYYFNPFIYVVGTLSTVAFCILFPLLMWSQKNEENI